LVKPHDFIAKWSDAELRERAGAQSHFIDLCKVLGEKAPTDADPKGEWYAFEKGAMKTGGGDGWADVWKRGCFAWEYKSPGKDLNAALKQLQYYVRSLENPPLLIVSDMERIELHTNWTNTVQEVHTLSLPELADARRRQILKKAFSESEVEELKPGKTREALTKEVAQEFVKLAQNLRERGHDPEKVAHFVNRMVFCMFAEDVDLLPDRLFKRMLEASLEEPESFADNAQKLFAAMAKKGGKVGFTQIDWFNGGVFEDDTALPLTKADIKVALAAANRNWSNIDPSIMGTLFERGLDPGKRSQLGAHYTDPDKIMLIVNPVIVEPLNREWEEVKPKIATEMEGAHKHKSKDARTKAENRAKRLKTEFIERLKNFRVLDPACGSGNFLYLALKELKNLEHRVNIECEQLGLARGFPVVGPECVKGIEINPFAAELARVSVWIGEIQWMREHGFDASRNPILKPLETIECRDALLNEDGSEAEWPEADVIIGNPPFLGATKFLRDLGQEYAAKLRTAYVNTVPAAADLVTYWFDRATRMSTTQRIGFVATNSVRHSASNVPVRSFASFFPLFCAWADEPWMQEGAAVRVSIICGSREPSSNPTLDGVTVPTLSSKLTLQEHVPLTLPLQGDFIYRGPPKIGPFDIDGTIAREWLASPRNPNGRPNSDVLRPIWNGYDIVRRPQDRWIIDFADRGQDDAALYEMPFEHVEEHVKPFRAENRREWRRETWWQHGETVPALRACMARHDRVIVTPMVSKHRLFAWMPVAVLPDQRLMIICRGDATTFGVLSSRAHEIWTYENCSWHGVGNDPVYNAGSVFETFPFPEGLTPNIPAAQYASDPRAKAIAEAAARLNELRENWLNPPELVKRVPEVVPTAEQREAGAEQIYPDRILPVDDKAAAILKKRTLTNLYNERPAWLDAAHRDLDAAVAAAYGWPVDLTDEQILERLFKLNQERAAVQ
jgi:type II restriction/modification system DNA methylase subunit YeeA